MMFRHAFDTGKDIKVGSFNAEDGAIRCIAFNSDATKLFCGCENGDVVLLSVDGACCRYT